jgi:enediyne polyketide synthase
MLDGATGRGVSIAHDGGRLLTLCGTGRVGCDLQRLGTAPRPWGELLPAARTGLWHALTHAIGDRDRAGALCWAIHEALVKARAADAEVAFAGIDNGAPRFRLTGGGRLAAGILELTLAGPTAIALAQPGEAKAGGRVTHYSRDIQMTFKEALPPLKSPTAPVYFGWMGELREEAMAPIRAPLARAFGSGGKGMVTNGTRLRILRPVAFQTPLKAWVWLERVLDSQPSTFELGFQWAGLDAAGQPREIVAEGVQRLTWVDVGADGHVAIEPFPDFFAGFIAQRRPAPGTAPFSPPLGRLPEPADAAAVLWRRAPGADPEHAGARLWLETDDAHSNYVGNIYFSHAAALVERTCRKALRLAGGCDGGFYATALELSHLGEAMPGDELEAEAHLVEIRPTWCCLDLVLVNRSRGGARIASGRARYQLFAGADDPQPRPLPDCLLPMVAEAVA